MLSLAWLLSPFKTSVLARNLSITFGETVLTKGLSFLTILMLTRALGPEDYGKYSFIFVTMTLCSALFDFGMENTAVRFSARDKEKKQLIFGLYFSAKLAILTVLTLFFLLLGPWLFSLMNKAEVIPYIPYLITGLIGESLFFVNDTYLQANQRFRLRAILNIARYSAALLYIGVLLSANLLLLQYTFYVYLVPVTFSLVFLPKYIGFLQSTRRDNLEKSQLDEILSYERWMFVYSIANNLLGRIDFFMLSLWVGFEALGLYNAAVQLCAIVSFLPFVLGKVLLPALAEKEPDDICQTTNRVSRTVMLISGTATLGIPLTGVIVPWLLGAEYAASVTVLQILLLAFIAGLIAMPYEQALYGLGQPRILSIARYLQLGIIILLNLLLIPLTGITGAALNTLIGRLLYLIFVKKWYGNYEGGLTTRKTGLLGMEPG